MKPTVGTCLLIVSVIAFAIVSFSQVFTLAQQSNTAAAQSEQVVPTGKKMLPENIMKEEEEKLDSLSASYDTQWNRYRASYFTCVVGAAFLSGLAGLLLQLSSTKKKPRIKDVATVLSFASASLITVNTLAGFNTAALANRVARNEVRKLKVQVLKGEITDRGEIEARKIEIEAKKGDAATGKS